METVPPLIDGLGGQDGPWLAANIRVFGRTGVKARRARAAPVHGIELGRSEERSLRLTALWKVEGTEGDYGLRRNTVACSGVDLHVTARGCSANRTPDFDYGHCKNERMGRILTHFGVNRARCIN